MHMSNLMADRLQQKKTTSGSTLVSKEQEFEAHKQELSHNSL